jgi:hypothetical protein
MFRRWASATEIKDTIRLRLEKLGRPDCPVPELLLSDRNRIGAPNWTVDASGVPSGDLEILVVAVAEAMDRFNLRAGSSDE